MGKQETERSVVPWDTETREDVAPKEGHLRAESMYLTSSLLRWMEETWGGVTTHVKTSTDVSTGEVTVYRAQKDEEGATFVRRTGALNTGEFSFWRPLHKLGLSVPPRRQFNVTPFTREVPGIGTVFVFPMKDRVSVPRNRKEETASAERTVGAVAPTGTAVSAKEE